MTNKNSHKNQGVHPLHDEDDTSGTGTGESSIAFQDFVTSGLGSQQRDETLSVDEKKRLLLVHKTNHEAKVKNLKSTLEQREQVRQQQISLAEYRQGKGFGQGMGLTKQHPLSQTAQFGSGAIDPKVNPAEMDAEINDDLKQELQYQHRLENRLENRNDNRYSPPTPSPFK